MNTHQKKMHDMMYQSKPHEWLEENYSDLYSWLKNTFGDLTTTAIDEITYIPDDNSEYQDHGVLLNIFTKQNSFNISIHKPTKMNKKGYIGLTYTDRFDGRGRDLEESSYSESGWEHILSDLLATDGSSLSNLLTMFKNRNI